MSCHRDNIQLECHTKSKQLVFQVTHTDDSEDQVKPPSPNEVIILIPKLDLDPAANGTGYSCQCRSGKREGKVLYTLGEATR